MSAAIDLFKSRPGFRHLWLGNVVSQLGDWIGWVAVAVLALRGGGGPLDVAMVFAAHHLPAAALTPVSGALADRFDRRRVLVFVSLLLAATTVVMAFVATTDWAVGGLQVLLIVRSGMSAFFAPAERAVLPRVVKREELLLAGVVDAGTWSVVFSLGMALGGALAMLGPAVALGIDALTFVVAAIMFARLPAMAPDKLASTQAGSRGMVSELIETLRYLGTRRELSQAIFAKGPLALAAGGAWLVLAVHADALFGAALGFGLLNAIRGVGTGVGPTLVAWRLGRGADRRRLWGWAYYAGLAGMVAFAASDTIAFAVLAVVLWGMGGGANWVLSGERIAALGPDRLQARLNSVDLIAMLGGQTVGVVALASWLDAGFGAAPGVAILASIAAAAWATLTYRSRPPSGRALAKMQVAGAP